MVPRTSSESRLSTRTVPRSSKYRASTSEMSLLPNMDELKKPTSSSEQCSRNRRKEGRYSSAFEAESAFEMKKFTRYGIC